MNVMVRQIFINMFFSQLEEEMSIISNCLLLLFGQTFNQAAVFRKVSISRLRLIFKGKTKQWAMGNASFSELKERPPSQDLSQFLRATGDYQGLALDNFLLRTILNLNYHVLFQPSTTPPPTNLPVSVPRRYNEELIFWELRE